MFTEDLEHVFGSVALALALCLPLTIYILSHVSFGERLQFRVLSFLCISLTALAIAFLNTEFVVPLRETADEMQGRQMDSDPRVLGALLSGVVLAVFGTIPTAFLHVLIKLRKRREGRAARAGSQVASKTAVG